MGHTSPLLIAKKFCVFLGCKSLIKICFFPHGSGESMAWLNSFDHRFNNAVRKLDVLRDQSLLDKLKLGTDM